MTQLDDYISKARSAGLDDEAIKNELRKAGWDESIIMNSFGQSNVPVMYEASGALENLPAQFQQHFSKPSIWRKLKIPVIIFFSVVAVGAGAYFGYNTFFNSTGTLLAESLKNTFTASSGHISFEMEVADKIEPGDDINDLSQIFGDNLVLKVTGQGNYKKNDLDMTDLDVQIETSLNLDGFNLGFTFATRVIGNDTYILMDDILLLRMLTGIDSPEVSSKWFKFNPLEFDSVVKDYGVQDIENTDNGLIEPTINKLFSLIGKYEYIKLGEKIGSEKVDGVNTTNYRLIINKNEIKKAITDAVDIISIDVGAPPQETKEAIQIINLFIDKADLSADIWISSDKYVRKMVYNFKLPSLTKVIETYDEVYNDVNSPDIAKALPKIKDTVDQADNSFLITVTSIYSDFGKNFTIEAPADAVDYLSRLKATQSKSRDGRRIADIKQIQLALGFYFDDNNSYPVGDNVVLSSTSSSELPIYSVEPKRFCLGIEGLTTSTCSSPYMGVIPSNPTPGGVDYVYTQIEGGKSYSLIFSLENEIVGIASGLHTATPDGIK